MPVRDHVAQYVVELPGLEMVWTGSAQVLLRRRVRRRVSIGEVRNYARQLEIHQ